jgi:hypothetical protein
MKKHLSISRRIKNAAASQSVENVKALHTYLHARADSVGEWGSIWSRKPECSWAHAFGRMRGFDQVWFGSVTLYDARTMENFLKLYERYPEVGGKDPRPISEASVHTLVNDVIEVADDGMSARGFFITPGVIHSVLTPMGHRNCFVLWERYGSDFVYEVGAWKYLHEQVCPDIMSMLDCVDWARDDYERLTSPNPGPGLPPVGEGPPVSDPGPLHFPFSVLQPPQDTVPWPESYATMNDDNTYTRAD